MKRTAVFFALSCAVSPATFAQAWKDAYDKALSAAKIQDWVGAKAAFQEAIAVRADDQSGPTVLPGPVTEPKRWRDGSPYSPNFGMGYSLFKQAEGAAEADRKALYQASADVFETLVNKGQLSGATIHFLNKAYDGSGDIQKQRELGSKLTGPMTWKVDMSFLTPEEAGYINSTMMSQSGNVVAGGTKNGTGPKISIIDTNQRNVSPLTSVSGPVPAIDTKFALIIGNSESQISSSGLPYAATDATAIRDCLVQNAGYLDKNCDVIMNGTADQIMQQAKACFERMPENGTLLIYFTGIGVNIDGKDYMAGIDASMTTDTSKMVAKEDLLGLFRAKSVKTFLFSQANRPMVEGRYFGMELPLAGQSAFCNATSPGDRVTATTKDGKPIGLYTKAFIEVLAEFRSNSVPITEFTWTIFQKMRGGGTNELGGNSSQVPSMPYLYNLAPDAKF